MLVYLFLSICRSSFFFFFFFNDTATTEIYTLSLHDALPICSLNALASCMSTALSRCCPTRLATSGLRSRTFGSRRSRSEEHTSELQSRLHLVCRLLLEKKKTHSTAPTPRSIALSRSTTTIYT